MYVKNLLPAVAVCYLAAGATFTAAGRPTNASFSSPPAQQSGDPQLTTVKGTVWLNSGKFVLRDESHRVWYQLDDQRLAARFEGEKVRVTGTLDASNKVIRVQNIEEDPVQYK
jgi:uncharacterized protein YdeI (BOF family)